MLLSITPAYTKVSAENGKKFGSILQKLKKDIDKPLSAILTLNTFANTIGAVGVGAEAQALWGDESLSIASGVVTITILIFSEIIPKTLGATYWKILAPAGAYILQGLIFVLWPFVKASQLITGLFTKNKDFDSISKNELELMTEMVEKEGNIRSDESKIIKNLLKFSDILTEDIMTPRTVAIIADENTTIKELYETSSTKHFSRIPIFIDSKDNITGYVLKDDILLKMIQNKGSEKLSASRIDVLKVHEELPLPELYEKLISEKQHIAIVVDEYDGLAGLVTMEDVIETLLGIEITDETDQIEDLQKFARKNWEYRAKKLGILAEDFDKNEEDAMD